MILAEASFLRHSLTGFRRSFGSKNIARTIPEVRKSSPIDLLASNVMQWDASVTEQDPHVQKLYASILGGSRSALASAITLVESRNARKRSQGNMLLKLVMEHDKQKYLKQGRDSLIFRIGISGSPGVGKSSFIEALGMELTEKRNKRVAVLTIDPTSAVTGGSVLGDLTRMQELSRHPNAYIRQSPTSGSMGGVTRGIHESIILCEGAGYDVVIIETVGVGQSEYAVADMCDLFCLLLSPAHGDELQGVKRGIMELSDLLVVTKDDGELRPKAKMTQADYISALKYLRPRFQTWRPQVLRSSILDPKSIGDVCEKMYEFWQIVGETGEMEERRKRQLQRWMWNHVRDEIMTLFRRHPKIAAMVPQLEKDIESGKVTPGLGAEILMRSFFGV